MPDVSMSTVVLLFNALDVALRVLLFIGGSAIAAHYLLMANYMRRAPHSVKALALPALTASGVGMAVCAASGAVNMGLIFGTLASALMVFVNLAAWAAGAYVSAQFERAAEVREQIRREGWAFVRKFDQFTDVASVLDSAPAPLEQREKERQ